MNARPIFRSIRSGPHWLLAGTTGGGKSNELNVMLVTLLARNKPSELRMVMIDLKGGLELSHYAGIPHLLIDDNVTKTGIITRPEDVPTALFWIVQEAERRMRIISSAGYSDLVDYNARRSAKNKIPYLLVICDELASVKLLDPKAGRASERLWADLGNRGRAVGISLIICTQYPDKAVLSPSIKAVLNAKLAFACSTYPSSLVILGNGDAKGLSPVGRFVYQSGSEHITIQAPYFPKMFRDELIAKIKYGTADLNIGRSHDVTELEVMEWALQNNNGILSFRRLFEIFKGRGLTQVELNKWLSSWENQQYRLLDAWYQVNPGAGQKPRMLKAIDNTNAPADEENQNTKHKTQSDADIQPYQPHDTDVKKSKYKRKKRMDELLDDIDQTEDDEEGL
ncbi:MAG: hypothetical protein EHM41_17320 [Chloroflexi bacterium]|nr:MAG: hypothetical protein EHM41_17320 [Chloroflexota bacterium]